ncbi:PFL_4669 family integrating conjugative element protein [Serratia sp. CY85251]|uniref:PFL_4669 family integrating conjugative element protein n=1 Tax=Serratia sp. CY85251 TaxID=3383696 RepID=UPI003FA12367
MVDSASNKENKSVQARAGALKSTLTIELHTLYAIRLWEGRRSLEADPETSGKRRPDIYSMPRFILRAGQINAASADDNPYADATMMALETALIKGTQSIQLAVAELEKTLANIPAQISLSDVASVSPLNIGVFSRTPVGYRCVFLLVGYDQLAMKAFQAWHYGLISRSERDALLDRGGHWIRSVYGVVQHYRPINITREDIRLQTPAGIDAVKRLGEPDADILSGAVRSTFSPPLRQQPALPRSTEAKPKKGGKA